MALLALYSFMVNKCSSYSTMMVFETPLTLSAVGNDDIMLQSKFFLFANAQGSRTLSTAKCPAPGLNMHQMPGVCQGGMLTAGIDSHITCTLQD